MPLSLDKSIITLIDVKVDMKKRWRIAPSTGLAPNRLDQAEEARRGQRGSIKLNSPMHGADPAGALRSHTPAEREPAGSADEGNRAHSRTASGGYGRRWIPSRNVHLDPRDSKRACRAQLHGPSDGLSLGDYRVRSRLPPHKRRGPRASSALARPHASHDFPCLQSPS